MKRTRPILLSVAALIAFSAMKAQSAVTYNWDFNDGTVMGWSPAGAGSTLIKDGLGPAGENTSQFCLGMNNNGASENLRWEIQKDITPACNYTFSFDYSAWNHSFSAGIYSYDVNGAVIDLVTVQDQTVWGVPSLYVNEDGWTHKSVSLSLNPLAVRVRIVFSYWATYGLVRIDNISLVPMSAGMLMPPNGNFESGGSSSTLAVNWTLSGNSQRSQNEARSGYYSIKTYDSGSGDANLTLSGGVQDINNLAIACGSPIRLSIFAKGDGVNAGSENASLKLLQYQNNVVKKQDSVSFVSRRDWQYIALSTVTPSDSQIEKVTIQFVYGSNNDGAGYIYWDDAGLSFGDSGFACAYNPYPPDCSAFVTDTNLYWSPGNDADSHDIYFGTDFNDVNNATRLTGDLNGDRKVGLADLSIFSTQWLASGTTEYLGDADFDAVISFKDFAALAENWERVSYDTPYKGKQSGCGYYVENLEYNKTYYWRVDELNDVSGKKPQKGKVWNFKGDIPITINIDANDSLYPFQGVGWNVHPAMFQYSNWDKIKTNLDSMQMQFARVILHMEWWYPAENQFTATSADMESVYNFLDYCETNNIKVLMHNWWTGGKYDEFISWPNHYWWLANCCHQDPTNSLGRWGSAGWWGTEGPETDYPYSPDAFGNAIAMLVHYLVGSRGYTCVKYVGIWNEPSGLWALNPRDMNGDGSPDFTYPQDFYTLYNKTSYYLNLFGVPDWVKLVGSDISVAANDSMDDFGHTLSAWSGNQRIDSYLGAMSFHSYSDDYANICSNARSHIIANNYDSDCEEILVGEMGNQSLDLSTAGGRVFNSLDSAKKMICFAKQGAYAMARWWYNGADSGWEATNGQGETIVPQNFNPVKLFANSLPNGSTDRYVISTTIGTISHGYFDCVGLKYNNAGKYKRVIWVVNDDLADRQISLNIDNLTSDTVFEKQFIDLSDLSCTIITGPIFSVRAADPAIKDSLPKKAIVVYKEL